MHEVCHVCGGVQGHQKKASDSMVLEIILMPLGEKNVLDFPATMLASQD